MRKNTGFLTLLVVALAAGFVYLQKTPQPSILIPQGASTIEVHFSPDGGCTQAIVNALADAKSSLDIQAYSFTSAPIASAVSAAHDRGVAVRVILDDGQKTAQYSSATYLKNHNVPVYMDSKHAIAHNKIMIIDKRVLVTGSFNFTKAAEESNSENLLIIRDNPELTGKYIDNFNAHLSHSLPY